jgi:uncharacterized membrane protein YfcA
MSLGWKVLLPLALIAVAGTALAVLVGDMTESVLVYALASGIFFAILVIGAYLLLGRGERRIMDRQEEEWANDPIITGERGIGWVLSQVVGGIIGLFFVIYDWTLKALDGLASLGERKAAERDASSEKSGSD